MNKLYGHHYCVGEARHTVKLVANTLHCSLPGPSGTMRCKAVMSLRIFMRRHVVVGAELFSTTTTLDREAGFEVSIKTVDSPISKPYKAMALLSTFDAKVLSSLERGSSCENATDGTANQVGRSRGAHASSATSALAQQQKA